MADMTDQVDLNGYGGDITELVLGFFNSPDVADYQRKLGRTFNLAEAATLVNYSFRPLEDKFRVWRLLAREMEDISLPKRFHDPIPSFKETLFESIRFDEKILDEFKKPSPDTAYSVSFRWNRPSEAFNFNPPRPESSGRIFRTLLAAKAFAMDTIAEENAYAKEKDNSFLGPIFDFFVEKLTLDSEATITGYFDQRGRLSKYSREHPQDSAPQTDDREGSFVDLWESYPLHISTPFEKGDLLDFMFTPDILAPCVLESKPETIVRLSDGTLDLWGNSTDLAFNFYYASGGEVGWDQSMPFLNLKRRQESLPEELNILKPISDLLKDKTCFHVVLDLKKDADTRRTLNRRHDCDTDYYVREIASK